MTKQWLLLAFYLLTALMVRTAGADTGMINEIDEAGLRSMDSRARRHAEKKVGPLLKELRDPSRLPLARYTDLALDVTVEKVIKELHRRGKNADADRIAADWHFLYRGGITRALQGTEYRDVGDHPPLLAFIDAIWARMLALIGPEATMAIMGDLYALNHEVVIVFGGNICGFDMNGVAGSHRDEFRRHFARGKVFWGLSSIVVKYAVSASCSVATGGLGLVTLICGPAGLAAEYIFGNSMAPGLSDFIFDNNCP